MKFDSAFVANSPIRVLLFWIFEGAVRDVEDVGTSESEKTKLLLCELKHFFIRRFAVVPRILAEMPSVRQLLPLGS
jgi:hypothetical protein